MSARERRKTVGTYAACQCPHVGTVPLALTALGDIHLHDCAGRVVLPGIRSLLYLSPIRQPTGHKQRHYQHHQRILQKRSNSMPDIQIQGIQSVVDRVPCISGQTTGSETHHHCEHCTRHTQPGKNKSAKWPPYAKTFLLFASLVCCLETSLVRASGALTFHPRSCDASPRL
jgi:hypothetical protein